LATTLAGSGWRLRPRGVFTSVADLKRKILRYIRLDHETAKPFQWKYSDVTKRIPA
jgi:hypothetical protein